MSQASPPAGGADTAEIVIATAGALLLSAAMIGLLLLAKAGRLPVLERMARLSERLSGMPGWASLPGTFLVGALIVAVFGMYWDISLHIDDGRDPGPLANPAHYLILFGLFGVLLAGVVSIAVTDGPTPTSIRLPALGWHVPVGGLILLVAGSFSLIAFPLDDVWHRLFGQDVTLWGPTHLMLIGGAALSILGAWALHVEGLAERREPRAQVPRWTQVRELAIAGAFLIGLSTFQAEFDFSVPQFRLVFHPILLMLAAGIGLVAARVRIGRGGALAAVAVFVAVRGGLALVVGEGFGQTMPHFPLYLGEAVAVEAVGLLFFRRTAASAAPLRFGAAAGAAVGTLGLAAEWGWSHLWMNTPWPVSLFPEAAVLGLLAAVAGGVIGGWIGRCLTPGVERAECPGAWTVPAAAVAVLVCVFFPLPMSGPDGQRAQLTMTELTPSPDRTVAITARVQPPDAAEDAEWFNATSWQGHQRSRVHALERVGPGVYRTTEPVPVSGDWKTTLRLADGRAVLGLPVFMPEDRAIPADEIPAPVQATRAFVTDHDLLQREKKQGVSGALTLFAYLAVLLVYLVVVGTIAWGLVRLARGLTGRLPGPPPRPRLQEPERDKPGVKEAAGARSPSPSRPATRARA